MAMKNKYAKRARISEAKIREIVRYVAADLTALQAAALSGLNRNTVNRLYRGVRERMLLACEAQRRLFGVVEVDESFFGARRVKGRRGRGAALARPTIASRKPSISPSRCAMRSRSSPSWALSASIFPSSHDSNRAMSCRTPAMSCRTPRVEARITPASAIPTVTMAMISGVMLPPNQSAEFLRQRSRPPQLILTSPQQLGAGPTGHPLNTRPLAWEYAGYPRSVRVVLWRLTRRPIPVTGLRGRACPCARSLFVCVLSWRWRVAAITRTP